jgi:hypothetical protein
MGASDRIDLRGVSAILDTNVVLEIYSIHDLFEAYDRTGADDVDAPELVFRRARARDSLLLAMYFHATRAKTVALPQEFQRILTGRVPPEASEDARWHFTWLFWTFVHKQVLSGWKSNTVPGSDDGLRGNKCDDRLVQIASDNSLPLITCEGMTIDGVVDAKIRKKATAAGVPVFTPREFWQGRLNAKEAIKFFGQRFDKGAPRYIRGSRSPAVTAESMNVLRGAYQHVLLGETEGRLAPVRVTMNANDD